MSDYREFVREKLAIKREVVGIRGRAPSSRLFPFQRALVEWALEVGKAALFCECGLGKTFMELDWARCVTEETRGQVLILAPLAVAQQTVREGDKFGIPVAYAREQSEARGPITITNYERLANFDPSRFAGVVLDESSIIKSFMGKVKRQIFEAFRSTPYKLAGTATPSPNDHMELGQHAEFLDVLTSHEMLARWFTNDTSSFGTYRLKGHAAGDFWAWVSSWARCVGSPADLGFSDDGYVLPALQVHQHVLKVDLIEGRGDELFRTPKLSATEIHKEKRRSIAQRADQVGEVLGREPRETWIVWCETDYEEDALTGSVPDAVPINGKMSADEKEERLVAFTRGEIRVLVTKVKIAGYGLNWQHCARTAFVGPTFSFEQYYQAIRRVWRFGQVRPVDCHVVMGSTEVAVWEILQRKQADHERMQAEMFAAARRAISRTDDRAVAYLPRGSYPLVPWVKEQA